MINKLYVYKSDSYFPYHNQAIEEYLLNSVDDDSLILYLWQNNNTIFIGKNQNSFNECNIKQLELDKGYLARRISGGGAVYHDLGNLNFTFICSNENYDVDRQNEVILNALKALDIEAYKSGRNDLLIDGKKFSGHAYYKGKKNSFHHGTLMLEVDQDKLNKYLNVSLLKLNSKNVSSVKSRVTNLIYIDESLTVERIVRALYTAFSKEFKHDFVVLDESDFDEDLLSSYEEKFSSYDWQHLNEKSFDTYIEKRFDWGTTRIEYEIENNIIKDIIIYTDALDVDSIELIPERFIGKNINELKYDNQIEKDVNESLKEKVNEL